ncbi:hypothetical protein K1719_017844 [Acacia pycnantha]|nr:hypothetical protein K1719_017844 [Acacia pycnantha]
MIEESNEEEEEEESPEEEELETVNHKVHRRLVKKLGHDFEKPMDQRQRLSQCFDKLMADVSRSLDSKNRDKFTQNLNVFRLEFRAKNN